MENKVVLITGATSGIGKATAHSLAEMGATVIILGRDRGKGDRVVRDIGAATGNLDLQFIECDLSSLDSVRRATAEFRDMYDRLDVLVNNAGMASYDRKLSVDGYELTFAVNHLAHHLLTTRILDVLIKSAPARIIAVSSTNHYKGHIDFDDLMGEKRYTVMRSYSQSKLANVLFTSELARRLEGTGVTANCLCPGYVRTGLQKRALRGLPRLVDVTLGVFKRSPERGARTSVFLASSPEVEGTTGMYFTGMKTRCPSREACDEAVAARLWEISEDLVGGTDRKGSLIVP